jgi:hypothetical protein
MIPIRLTATCCTIMTTVLLGACTADASKDDNTLNAEQTSSTPATPTSEPTYTSSTPSSGADVPGAPDLSAFGEEELEPGRYTFLPFGGSEADLPEMQVPDGFAAYKGFAVGASKGPFRSVMVWTIDTVDLQPCKTSGPTRIGPSPDALAEALSRQRLTTTTAPERIELGGHQGLYLEVTAPTGRRFTDCNSFDLWGNDGGGLRYLQGPGQVERLWILDVPGERLVIDASSTQGVTPSQEQQLRQIAESARFRQPVTP